MDALKQWAFSICCAMVACGMAQLLLPKSGMERIFKLCVSVFFLCALLSPILLASPELRISVEEYSQEDIQRRAARLEELVESQAERAAGESLEKIVADKLLEKGIKYSSITININTSGQNTAQAPMATIILDREHESRHEAIHRELTAELGLEVRLGYA